MTKNTKINGSDTVSYSFGKKVVDYNLGKTIENRFLP